MKLLDMARLAPLVAAICAAAAAACQANVSGSDAHAAAGSCDLADGVSADDCAKLHALALPATLPPAHGNAKADDDRAAQLGFEIFYDARFSANQNVRCATCHLPEKHFVDGKQVSVGLVPITRNAPILLDAARMDWVFWDGRADSLWSQPLFAFESPKEMGYSRLELAHRVLQSYQADYESVFGPLPPLTDAARFPPAGKPGDAAFDAMAAADKDAVDLVAANVGKALEAYVRKLSSGPSPFDRFLGGDGAALTDGQKKGMVVYVQAGCLDCHGGPMLSDDKFHNLGVPALPGADPDRGRADGLPQLEANPFNGQGRFFDGAPLPKPDPASPADLGAFRTPSLRNIALSAPYGHDGVFDTLDAVVRFHLAGGGAAPGASPTFVGTVDEKMTPRALSDEDVAHLVDFLGALTGSYPLPPWNDWPTKG